MIMPPDWFVRAVHAVKSFVQRLDDLSIAIHQQTDAVRENTQAQKEATEEYEKKPELPSSIPVILDWRFR